jgi:hypothetical protein
MSNTHLDRELRDFLISEMKNLLIFLDDQLQAQKVNQENQNTNDQAKNTKKKRDLASRMLSKLKKIYDKEKH